MEIRLKEIIPVVIAPITIANAIFCFMIICFLLEKEHQIVLSDTPYNLFLFYNDLAEVN